MKFKTRFAPSPTGYLHLGHAYSALLAFRMAEMNNGIMELRIEDIDPTRCKPEFESTILEDLAWLGVSWPQPVRRQSDHLDLYQQYLEQLIEEKLVYRCFKTRREILEEISRAPHHPGEGPDQTIYRGPESPLSEDEESHLMERGLPFAWRLSIRRCHEVLGERLSSLTFLETGASTQIETGTIQVDPGLSGDVILARKDAGTSYFLSCVIDDAVQGITHIVRGEDLFSATHVQRLLQTLLDLREPIYHHHKLLVGPDGKRYAKRDQSVTLRALRNDGHTSKDILSMIGLS